MIRETGVARSHKTHNCLTCRAESREAGMAVSKDNHRRPTRAHCGIRTFTHCLSPFGQLHQSTIDWRAYTQQTPSPPSGGCEVQGQGVSGARVWRGPVPHRWQSSRCNFTWWKGAQLLWAHFNKRAHLIHEGLLSGPNHLPKVPLLNATTLGDGTSTSEFNRDVNIQSVALTVIRN